jgi:hypothetical protein
LENVTYIKLTILTNENCPYFKIYVKIQQHVAKNFLMCMESMNFRGNIKFSKKRKFKMLYHEIWHNFCLSFKSKKAIFGSTLLRRKDDFLSSWDDTKKSGSDQWPRTKM